MSLRRAGTVFIEFGVENFRSIKERITLSMVAAKLRDKNESLDENNLVEVSAKLSLLRSAVIYGANASGKSNLLKALDVMSEIVLNSARWQAKDKIPAEPFVLNAEFAKKPSGFEIVFLMDGLQYRYGFEVTVKQVVREWLFFVPTNREVPLFLRDEDGIEIRDRFKEGKGFEKSTLENNLFLSVVAKFKSGGIADRILDWFSDNCRILIASNDLGYFPYTIDCIKSGKYKTEILEMVRQFDLGISDILVKQILKQGFSTTYLVKEPSAVESVNSRELNGTDIPSPYRKGDFNTELRTRHSVLDNEGKAEDEIELSAKAMESEGTLKLIALMGPIINILSHGSALFIDEIDSRFHPAVTAALFQLFNSPRTNPNNAQLICASHDTSLLDRYLFRRDQINFIEKNRFSASHLYTLADFKMKSLSDRKKTVNTQESIERNYLLGRYGAIPYIGFFDEKFLNDWETGHTLVKFEKIATENLS